MSYHIQNRSGGPPLGVNFSASNIKMTKESFKDIRKQLRYTQSELGELLGVKPRTVQDWE